MKKGKKEYFNEQTAKLLNWHTKKIIKKYVLDLILEKLKYRKNVNKTRGS